MMTPEQEAKCREAFEAWFGSDEDDLYRDVAYECWQAAWQDAQPQWLPIESAPRDGTVFVAVNARGQACEVPNPYFLCFSSPAPGEGQWAAEAGWRMPGRDWPCYPTHWMPLPKPPTSDKENE